jgi:hypothetical protein
MRSKLISLLCLLALLPLAAHAQQALRDENVIHSLPAGYKVDFQDRKGDMIITEMVPQAESVKDWTEMLTTQIFLGMTSTTPAAFQARMQQEWKAACQGAEIAPVASGQENGYPFAVWVQGCPLNSATGKPETTWFKAIQGKDSFYVVQRAFRSKATDEQATAAMQHLREVAVCDTRVPGSACVKADKPAQ